MLGFVLRAVMLQLLAAAVATFSSLQRLFEQTFCFHDGRGFFLRQQDVRRGTAAGEEESLLAPESCQDGRGIRAPPLTPQQQRIRRGRHCDL